MSEDCTVQELLFEADEGSATVVGPVCRFELPEQTRILIDFTSLPSPFLPSRETEQQLGYGKAVRYKVLIIKYYPQKQLQSVD